MTNAPVDAPSTEEPEGLDDFSGPGWGTAYPLDSVFVRPETRTVGEVLRRIDAKRYVLTPDFERDFVWSDEKQSKLIESCVMRIPLPVFYLAEAPDGRIIVVDGLQRLTSFHRFTKNQLRLRGLNPKESGASPHPLEGRRFDELPLLLQERILDTQLTMYILDSKAPDRARLDIFERVNSGEPLTKQQMRNALYNGPATEWLREMAQLPSFLQATGRSLNPKTMRDREAINRFAAFSLLGWESYKSGDMDGFLATSLDQMNKSGAAVLSSLRERFGDSMRANSLLFGEHAFRKSLASSEPHANRSILNIALFDVCSVLLAPIATDILTQPVVADRVQGRMIALIENDEFARAITYSTNSTQAVSARFAIAESGLADLSW